MPLIYHIFPANQTVVIVFFPDFPKDKLFKIHLRNPFLTLLGKYVRAMLREDIAPRISR